jgi:hypothetical protein
MFYLARLLTFFDSDTFSSKILSGFTPPTIIFVSVFLPRDFWLGESSSSKSQETGLPYIGSIHLLVGLNYISA